MTEFKDTITVEDKITPKLNKINKSFNNFGSRLDKIKNKFPGFARSGANAFQKIDNQLQKFNSTISFAGKAFAAAFSIQKITQVGGAIAKMGMSFEDALIDLETMLGSSSKAQKMFNDIQDMAIKTPFETKDLLENTKMLIAMGVEESKVLKYTKMLGDISGGNREKFNSLALNFGQVASNKLLQGQDFKSFAMAGFNPLSELSKMSGKTEAQLRKDMSKGAISFEMLVKAMERTTSKGGRFYKLMDKRSQTFSGKLSTLSDSISLWAGTVGMTIGKKLTPLLDKFGPIVEKSLNRISPLLIKATDSFVNFFNRIANNPAYKSLHNQFVLLSKDIKEFVANNPEIKEAFKWLMDTALPKTLEIVAKAIRGVVKTAGVLSEILKGIGGFIGNVIGAIITIPDKLATAFTKLRILVVQTLMPVFDLLRETRAILSENARAGNNIASQGLRGATYNNSVTNDSRNYGGNVYNFNQMKSEDITKLIGNSQYAIGT